MSKDTTSSDSPPIDEYDSYVCQAILTSLQSSEQIVSATQSLIIECNESPSQLQTCLDCKSSMSNTFTTLKDLDDKFFSNVKTKADFANQMCRNACDCVVDNINMGATVTVDATAFQNLEYEGLVQSAEQIVNALVSNLKLQTNKDGTSTTVSDKPRDASSTSDANITSEIKTHILNLLKKMQDSTILQNIEQQAIETQNVDIRGTNGMNITNINLSQGADLLLSNIQNNSTDTSQALQSIVSALQNYTVAINNNTENNIMTYVIYIACLLFMIIIFFFFLSQLQTFLTLISAK